MKLCAECGQTLYQVRHVVDYVGPSMAVTVHLDTITGPVYTTDYGNNWLEVLDGDTWIRLSEFVAKTPAPASRAVVDN